MENDRINLYNDACIRCSKETTNIYSTSFSLGVKLLSPQFRDAVYSIYGFVRFADEIVDSFHHYNKSQLLENFKLDTYKAIDQGISTNPILQSFQLTVNKYDINRELINAFLKSMEMDLTKTSHDKNGINDYIYGSAEVVGLMCLKVFCNGDLDEYNKLKEPASRLGSAFQKINFLRDINADYYELGRVYFPGIDFSNFTKYQKKEIEDGIKSDFDAAYMGIIKLNNGAKLGVYLAYRYYLILFLKIKKISPQQLLLKRYRVSNLQKIYILILCYIRFKLGLI